MTTTRLRTEDLTPTWIAARIGLPPEQSPGRIVKRTHLKGKDAGYAHTTSWLIEGARLGDLPNSQMRRVTIEDIHAVAEDGRPVTEGLHVTWWQRQLVAGDWRVTTTLDVLPGSQTREGAYWDLVKEWVK